MGRGKGVRKGLEDNGGRREETSGQLQIAKCKSDASTSFPVIITHVSSCLKIV